MTTTEHSIVFREVEIRTWPERSDLLVIDLAHAVAIAHYPLQELPGPLFDPLAPYEERAAQAVESLEGDQDYLRAHFSVAPDHEVKLQPVRETRARIESLLADYGLRLDDTSLTDSERLLAKLDELSLDDLYELLCDWHDVVERHYPAGSSRMDERSWVHRAQPSSCYHWRYLACGLDPENEGNPDEQEEAYELFRSLIDVALENLTYGHLLRYAYFHRAEFPRRERFELRALAE